MTPAAITGAFALAAVLLIWAVRLPRLARWAGRMIIGHHADGIRRTNSTFTRGADRILHPTGRASRWAHLAGWQRSAVRLAVTALAVLAGAALATGSPWLWAAVAVVALSGLSVAVWRAVVRWRDWRHTRTLVRPLARALAPLLGIPVRQAMGAVRFPRSYASVTTGELGRIILPDSWHPDMQGSVTKLVKSRLPVDADLSWRLTGKPLFLQVNASPKPPERVAFADLRAEMAKCLPGDVVIGLDRKREVYRGSFRTADPHWGLSVNTGRGKSSFLMMVAAQILHQDSRATVTAIDPKMTSLDPLVGVPGFSVANDPRDVPGMWASIDGFAAEMERRMDARKADPTTEFPMALLIIDELNQFAAMTAAVYREQKESGDPSTPPIWNTIASIIWQGRQFACCVILVGQRLDSRATGNIGLRDSLGLKALGGFTQQQWAMLVGTSPVPRSQKPRGRMIFWDGEEHTWVQTAYGTGEELRDYAMEGRRDMSGVAVPDAPQPAETGSPRTDTWVVGLAAAAEHLGLSPAAFEKRRQRAGGTLPGETRKGNQPAWTAADLDAWRASWPRVVATEGEASHG